VVLFLLVFFQSPIKELCVYVTWCVQLWWKCDSNWTVCVKLSTKSLLLWVTPTLVIFSSVIPSIKWWLCRIKVWRTVMQYLWKMCIFYWSAFKKKEKITLMQLHKVLFTLLNHWKLMCVFCMMTCMHLQVLYQTFVPWFATCDENLKHKCKSGFPLRIQHKR